MTIIISGFPGIGKTTFVRNHPELDVLDSDSSAFSTSPDFPQNYINHVKDRLGKVDVILLSSHKAVRNALVANNIKHFVVFPAEIDDLDRYAAKAEYLRRYKDRGNSEDFINLVNSNWETWVDDIINTAPSWYALFQGQYLEDVYDYLKETML